MSRLQNGFCCGHITIWLPSSSNREHSFPFFNPHTILLFPMACLLTSNRRLLWVQFLLQIVYTYICKGWGHILLLLPLSFASFLEGAFLLSSFVILLLWLSFLLSSVKIYMYDCMYVHLLKCTPMCCLLGLMQHPENLYKTGSCAVDIMTRFG